ncbi:MAG: VWA domain-containing protein [Spirochaetales bacterium]|nr:VWA domain-containing protein [Spirochaetales bacterium]
MLHFDAPLAFLLLLIFPFLIYMHFRGKKKTGIRFSSTQHAARVPVSLRQRLSVIPFVLRLLALLLFIIAIARPQEGKEMVRDMSRGVAIEMVLDRSSSMTLMKDIGNKTYTRLDIVKEAFEEFVGGSGNGPSGGSLAGRPQDLIGMIAFARYADTMCPLTLSHGALLRFSESVKTVVPGGPEDGTSIGDAVALAAARLKTAEASLAEQLENDESDYEIKSKVIILLTDGEDTGIGKRTPLEAAELAAEWGIKIYTIGLSGRDWYAIQEDFFGRRRVPVPSRVDTSILKKMADETGGIFRIAEDLNSLKDIYGEIDSLEKSEIESIRFLDYRELFVPFALIALILLIAEAALSATIWRRIP